MRYVSTAPEGSIFPKLAGTYEKELHPLIEEIALSDYRRVVNVGSAEGYYAVGLARRLERATVFACDIDESARTACKQLAQINGLADRVIVTDRYPSVSQSRAKTLFVVDCEGCEREMLDPARIPELQDADVLVELHEFLDPEIASSLAARFMSTHDITLIQAVPRSGHDAPQELRSLLTDREWQWALDELRPAGMRWGWYRARTRQGSSSRQ